MAEDQSPAYVTQKVHDVGKNDIDKDDLLRLASDRPQLPQKQQREDNDAYDIRFNIKPRIIHTNARIIVFKIIAIII